MEISDKRLEELVKARAKKYMESRIVEVLPVFSDGTVLVNRQYRKTSGEWGFELPRGKIDEGEKPEDAAARELREETGFRADSLKLMFATRLVANIDSMKSYYYLAEGLHEGEPNREEGEQIETNRVSMGELMALIRDGKMSDTSGMSAVMYYNMFLARH
ncbi:NUDIX hydrolase [Candidatus Marsarchaeota archaeon]|nr:NUDIX hydrolase [Candidatus Marsarchaeota archaeon]